LVIKALTTGKLLDFQLCKGNSVPEAFTMSVKNVVAAQPSSSRFDQKSLLISIMGLRVLGIPMDLSGIRSPIFRSWSIVFGWISFLANIVGNIVILADMPSCQSTRTTTMTTAYLAIVIKKVTFTFLLVTAHAAHLLYMGPNWKELLQILKQIEQLQLFKEDDYRNLQNIFFVGNITFVILVKYRTNTIFYSG